MEAWHYGLSRWETKAASTTYNIYGASQTVNSLILVGLMQLLAKLPLSTPWFCDCYGLDMIVLIATFRHG